MTWLVDLGDRISGVRDLQFSIGEAVLVDVVVRKGDAGVFVDEGGARGRGGPRREILGFVREGRGLKGRIERVLRLVREEGLRWRGAALLLRVLFRREAFEGRAWRAVRRVDGIEGFDV